MISAMQTLAVPPQHEDNEISNAPPSAPRWEPLDTELWLGNIELYNSRLEGYEAIVALEVIEHLEPNLLSRFGVVTMGTYRPKLLLVSTPVSANFFPLEWGCIWASSDCKCPTGDLDSPRVARTASYPTAVAHLKLHD